MKRTRFHSTTILSVRREGHIVMAGDGQVTLGQTVMKSSARKVRRMNDDQAICGFAGSAADGIALFDRLEGKLREHGGNLRRAAVEMAKDWRMDRVLRRLDAMIVVADTKQTYLLSGTGDVIEPDDGMVAIGSGGPFALAAARALVQKYRYVSPCHCRDRHAASPARSACTPITPSPSRSWDERCRSHAGSHRGCSGSLHRGDKPAPSGPWPWPCAIAGAGSRSRASSRTRSRPRTSS